MQVPLSLLFNPAPRDVGALTPEQHKIWVALRSEIGTASAGGEFDPRMMMRLRPSQLASWRARRYQWARELLQHDSRVVDV